MTFDELSTLKQPSASLRTALDRISAALGSVGDAGQQARSVVDELRVSLRAAAAQSVKSARSLAKFDEINRLSAPAETVMLALNASQGPTREQAVREALNYAVDKQTLVDSVLYGTQQVADTLFAPSVPYAPQDLTPRRYDPTKARALLEQAGWQQLEGQPWRQKAGQPLAIELAFIGTDALAKSMAEIIQANLRQVGVQVTLVGEEESSIYARQREGRFGMIFNRTWGAPYDPHAFLSSMRVPSHADYQAQRGLPDKALIDKEISEVLTTGDETQRRKLYHDVLTRLHQNAVYLPISYVSLMSVARQEVGEIPFAPVTSEIPFDQITPVTP